MSVKYDGNENAFYWFILGFGFAIAVMLTLTWGNP